MPDHKHKDIFREGYNGPAPVNPQPESALEGVDLRAGMERGHNGPPQNQNSEPKMPPPPPPKRG